LTNVIYLQLGPEDPRTKDSDLWLKELTTNAVILAQQAREDQAKKVGNGTSTVPVSNGSAPAAALSVPEVPRGELPIDQVLQYINGESTGARKGKKKTQKKHK
jgi:protein TIF31